MSVTAPPGPPRSSDPVGRDEVEALVEALIEEASRLTLGFLDVYDAQGAAAAARQHRRHLPFRRRAVEA